MLNSPQESFLANSSMTVEELFMLRSLLHVKATDTICVKQHMNFLLDSPLSQICTLLSTRICVLEKRKSVYAIVSMQIVDWLAAKCGPIESHFQKNHL